MKIRDKFILIILLIFIILSFINISKASTEDFWGKEFPTLPSDFYNYTYKVIIYDYTNRYYVFLNNRPFIFNNSLDCLIAPGYTQYYYVTSNTDIWNEKTTWFHETFDYEHLERYFTLDVRRLIYSSHTIRDSNNEIIFYKTNYYNTPMLQKVFGGYLYQNIPYIVKIAIIFLVSAIGLKKSISFLTKTTKEAQKVNL